MAVDAAQETVSNIEKTTQPEFITSEVQLDDLMNLLQNDPSLLDPTLLETMSSQLLANKNQDIITEQPHMLDTSTTAQTAVPFDDGILSQEDEPVLLGDPNLCDATTPSNSPECFMDNFIDEISETPTSQSLSIDLQETFGENTLNRQEEYMDFLDKYQDNKPATAVDPFKPDLSSSTNLLGSLVLDHPVFTLADFVDAASDDIEPSLPTTSPPPEIVQAEKESSSNLHVAKPADDLLAIIFGEDANKSSTLDCKSSIHEKPIPFKTSVDVGEKPAQIENDSNKVSDSSIEFKTESPEKDLTPGKPAYIEKDIETTQAPAPSQIDSTNKSEDLLKINTTTTDVVAHNEDQLDNLENSKDDTSSNVLNDKLIKATASSLKIPKDDTSDQTLSEEEKLLGVNFIKEDVPIEDLIKTTTLDFGNENDQFEQSIDFDLITSSPQQLCQFGDDIFNKEDDRKSKINDKDTMATIRPDTNNNDNKKTLSEQQQLPSSKPDVISNEQINTGSDNKQQIDNNEKKEQHSKLLEMMLLPNLSDDSNAEFKQNNSLNQESAVNKIQHPKNFNSIQSPTQHTLDNKVEKPKKSSNKCNLAKQINLDLSKLLGSEYIEPKDQYSRNDAFTISNEKKKPSCELFAPQRKRVFTKDYSNYIPKHLLSADNTVKPPNKLVNRRKFITRYNNNKTATTGDMGVGTGIAKNMPKEDRKRQRSPPDNEDNSPNHKQMRLSPPQNADQHHVMTEHVIKETNAMLQTKKCSKRKFEQDSSDFEPECKMAKSKI